MKKKEIRLNETFQFHSHWVQIFFFFFKELIHRMFILRCTSEIGRNTSRSFMPMEVLAGSVFGLLQARQLAALLPQLRLQLRVIGHVCRASLLAVVQVAAAHALHLRGSRSVDGYSGALGRSLRMEPPMSFSHMLPTTFRRRLKLTKQQTPSAQTTPMN